MAKNTSITLGDHFESFVTQQVQSGRYGSTREVIRSALRLLENQEAKLETLRRLLIEGEQSGVADYDLNSFINELDSEAMKLDYLNHCFESAKKDLKNGETVDGGNFLNSH